MGEEQPNIATVKEVDKQNQAPTFWSQLPPFMSIITLIIGFFLNSGYEQYKRAEDVESKELATKRLFIDKQLSDFYYPLKHHLQIDDAVWLVWKKSQFSKDKSLANYIESKILLPNHDSSIAIIDNKFNLIRNVDEKVNIISLNNELNKYHRHVAVYKALRTMGDKRNPISLKGYNAEFPNGLEKEIDKRIVSLEGQRLSL